MRSRPITVLLTALAGAASLAACGDADNGTTTTAPPPVTTVITPTVTDTLTPVSPGDPSPVTVTETTTEPDVSIPGGSFTGIVASVPETDPAPFASSLIFPAQPGLQFVGPDGTFCEMYGTAGELISDVQVLCTHDGAGDINAVVLTQGGPAGERNVNRIFMPHADTRTLQPGQRISDGPVTCAVAEGETRVMCAISPYSFAVSTDGVDLD